MSSRETARRIFEALQDTGDNLETITDDAVIGIIEGVLDTVGEEEADDPAPCGCGCQTVGRFSAAEDQS